jgi:hypothetical protein
MPQEKTPLDLRYLPERKDREEPITGKQITTIIHLTGCESQVLEHLGKLQASALIENILNERDEIRGTNDASRHGKNGRKKAGYGSLVVLILLGGVCFLIWKFSLSPGGGNPFTHEPALAADTDQSPSIKQPENPARQEGGPGSPTPPSATTIPDKVAPEEQIERLDGRLESLEGIDLPSTILVLSPIQLLDPAGKETTVPADTELEVLTRREGGTLTMRSGEKTFVGNESRLQGKVRLLDHATGPE